MWMKETKQFVIEEDLVERVHSLWYTCNTSEETNMNLGDQQYAEFISKSI